MSEAIERGGAALDLSAAEVRAADRAARTWEAGECGPIVLGSEAHKRAFCRMLLDTHNPYRPSIVDWPALDPEARDRLVSLPIWDIAMQTEGNASLRVLSYANTISDPLLREAVEIDGFEETRHKQVLSNLVAAYGIRLAPEPEYLPPETPGMGLSARRVLRMRRHLLCLRPVRVGQTVGLFPARTRRHLRAGRAGGRPSYYLFRKLGGVAPAQPAGMAAHSFRGQDRFGVGIPRVGEDRLRPRHRRRGWDAARGAPLRTTTSCSPGAGRSAAQTSPPPRSSTFV